VAGPDREGDPVLTFGVILVATVAWGALAFGGVYSWAYWPLAIMSACLGLWAAVATRFWEDRRIRALAIALGAVAAAIGVQLIVLPSALLTTISPGVDRFLRQFRVAYQPASLHPLSIAPDATAVGFALFVALALLLIGTTRAMRFIRVEWLVGQLLGLGAGLALIGLAQQALLDEQAPLVYGFWRPQSGASPYGPFINKNHFAGWMVMVLPLVAGYAYALFLQTPRPARSGMDGWLRWAATVHASRFVSVAIIGLVMALSVVLTGSRSGLASLLVALGFLGLAVRRSAHGVSGRTAMLGLPALLIAGAFAWGGADSVIERFGRAPSELADRVAAWRDTLRIIGDFPVFGSGLNTYGRAMLVYQTGDRTAMFEQAHNDYLQLIAEGGFLVGLPALAAIVLAVSGIRRRLMAGQDDQLTAWIRTGAAAGLIGIAAQSLVEFSLQMPGNAVLFVVLMAIALHRPSRSRHAAGL
jgi:hypothetical protein